LANKKIISAPKRANEKEQNRKPDEFFDSCPVWEEVTNHKPTFIV